MQLRGKSVRSWCDGSSDRSFMVDPLNYFSFHPVLHDWCNKGRGMCYPVCVILNIGLHTGLTEPDSTVVMSANVLVGTGFTFWYRLQPRVCF